MKRRGPGSTSAPIGWGILGTGSIARIFARELQELPDARLVAVGSRSRERAEAFGTLLGIPHRHGSYADLVADPDVDVAYIATPASAHRENMLVCLEAGKAALCEKPFTVDAGEARDVVAAARRHRVFLMEAMWMRYVPAIVKLRALLAAGAIGDVRYLTADLGTPAGPEPKPRIVSRELGGGALLQKGIYLISLASMIFGRPDRVASLVDPSASGVDEHSGVVLGYPGGKLALLLCSNLARTSREATVVGTAGLIRIHSPVHCPPALTLSLGPDGRGSGRTFRLPEPLIRYGKRSRLLRWLRERYGVLGERVVHGIQTRVIRAPVTGEGLSYQAVEVMRCLRAGLSESHVMPLDESVTILETADEIRRQWNFR